MNTSNSLSKTKLTAFVLAINHGSGMHSSLSKYLHPIAGVPMILRVIKTLQGLSDQKELPVDLDICIVTAKDTYPQIKELLSSYSISYIQQDDFKNAVDSIKSNLMTKCDSKAILFVNANSFLIQINDFISMIKNFQKSSVDLTVAIHTQNLDFLKHQIEDVIKDDNPNDFSKKFRSSIYIIKKAIINDLLSFSHSYQKNDLADHLADVFFKFLQKKQAKVSYIPLNKNTSYPVDSQRDLAIATKKVFQRKNEQLMDKGVIIVDPENTYIEDDVDIRSTAIIHPNTYISGNSQIAEGCEIEPNSIIRDSKIDCCVKVKAGSYLEGAVVGSHSLIGPYARLRPQTHIGSHCKIGNFVETKNAVFADHVKASHLTYLGDVEIGSNVNIGCGTITCNYREDGKKYKTLIEDNVFVGSDVQFVAPVKVGKGSVIGSGSTITDEVPSDSLAIARAKQVIKPDWAVHNKKSKKINRSSKS